ncbi:MAG: putative basic amino acid antiporter YfcC [Peptostreptococcaceae bacterium]|nr:putative basic amino acid antiporter YfcC [Peptostreptococcaceae bacterium]
MGNTEQEVVKKKSRVPHVYIILLAVVLFCSILTYIVPAGTYDMVTLDSGREVVDAATFHTMDSTPVNLMQFLTAVPRGMQETALIIFFIFIVGGSFAVLNETGAIEAGLGKMVKALKGKEIMVIPVAMIVFSLLGAINGMAEETLPFIPIFVSLCIAMGYDSLTGTAIVFIGAGSGFAGAFLNPFTIGVAQGIAGLPLFSGIQYRIVIYIVMVTLGILFVMRYATKVRKNPELSPMRDIDLNRTDNMDLDNLHVFGVKEKAILGIFVASMVLLVIGVIKWGWYINEIAGLFFGMAILCALVGGLGLNQYAISLGEGMAAIATGALVVGFARAILVVLTDGNILFTILHSAANVLNNLPSMISAVGMYIFQCFLNFIVPSGSGQAAVSIPILAPLGDLVGVTRQTTCIAYQLGDGISNIFTPTSGYFMAGLGLARIPWDKWAKWILPLIGAWYVVGAIFVAVAQSVQLGPF